MDAPRRGWSWASVLRRVVFLPFAVAFVLGLAMVVLGAGFAVGELAWDLQGRMVEGVVIERYEKRVETREAGRISTDTSVEPWIAYEFVDADGRARRGDARHTYRYIWAQIRPGDRIEIEHLPNGDSRLAEVDASATMWLTLAAWGIPLLVVGGVVTFVIVRLEMGAGRLTHETIGAAMNPGS